MTDLATQVAAEYKKRDLEVPSDEAIAQYVGNIEAGNRTIEDLAAALDKTVEPGEKPYSGEYGSTEPLGDSDSGEATGEPGPDPHADDKDDRTCTECGFVAETTGGLSTHKRSHD